MLVLGPLQGQLNCIRGSGGNTGGLQRGGTNNDSSSSDEERGNRISCHCHRKAKGNVVTNPHFQEKLRVLIKMMGFLISRLARVNIQWGRRCICVHYHSEGECHDDCAFKQNHMDMPPPVEKAYGKFVKKTKKAYKEQSTADDSNSDKESAASSPTKKAKAGDDSD